MTERPTFMLIIKMPRLHLNYIKLLVSVIKEKKNISVLFVISASPSFCKATKSVLVVMKVNANLPEQLRGRIRCQDGSGHIWAHSVELLNLSLPHLQQALPGSVHPLASRPLALQVEGEAGLLSLSPENNQEACGK